MEISFSTEKNRVRKKFFMALFCRSCFCLLRPNRSAKTKFISVDSQSLCQHENYILVLGKLRQANDYIKSTLWPTFRPSFASQLVCVPPEKKVSSWNEGERRRLGSLVLPESSAYATENASCGDRGRRKALRNISLAKICGDIRQVSCYWFRLAISEDGWKILN